MQKKKCFFLPCLEEIRGFALQFFCLDLPNLRFTEFCFLSWGNTPRSLCNPFLSVYCPDWVQNLFPGALGRMLGVFLHGLETRQYPGGVATHRIFPNLPEVMVVFLECSKLQFAMIKQCPQPDWISICTCTYHLPRLSGCLCTSDSHSRQNCYLETVTWPTRHFRSHWH